MRKILFIIPELSTGGTNSSLESLYLLLKNRFDIKVYAISHQPCNHKYAFDEVLMPQNVILSLLYSNFTAQRGLKKFLALWLKLLQSFLRMMKVDLGLICAKHVIRLLESSAKYDVVVGFQEGYATKLTSLFKNSNKIAWIHCNYDFYLPNDKTEESIYVNYNRIVCVSKYTARIFTNRYPSLMARTIAIHNIIDADRIRELAERPIDDYRFLTDKLVILSVGRFSSIKRFRDIPSIAYKLKKEGLLFRWYIIGPQDGKEEMDAFTNNLEKHSVQDCIIWLGGKSNPYPYFKAANLYVCLSKSEACPMVFKEAQLFGLPIVTTDFPSAYEFIHEGEGIIESIDNISHAIQVIVNKTKDGCHKEIRISNESLVQMCNIFDGDNNI